MSNNFLKVRNGINLKPQGSDPANGQDGDIYFNSGIGKFKGYSNGVWKTIGSGEAGLPNYVLNPSAADSAVLDITLTNATATRETDASEFASTFFKITTTNANTEAKWSLSAIDLKDSGKVMQVRANVLVDTATNPAAIYRLVLKNITDVVDVAYQDVSVGINTQVQFDFAADSSKTYVVILEDVSGTTSGDIIYVTDVYVGPGLIAAIDDDSKPWTSYTPTVSNVTLGAGSASGFYRRNDDTMELQITLDFAADTSVSGSIVFSIPSGFTIDTSKLTSNIYTVVGTAMARGNNAANIYVGTAFISGSGIGILDIATAGQWNASRPATWGSSATNMITVLAELPIVEWATPSKLFIQDSTPEFPVNTSSATNTDDTTSFAYNANGVNFVAINEPGQWTKKRIKLSRAMSPTEEFKLLVTDPNSVTADNYNFFPPMESGGQKYGLGFTVVDSTTIDVQFGGDGARPGEAWSSFTTYKWKGARGKIGSLSGFNLATATQAGLYQAGQVPGFVGGTPIPAGCVGEVIQISAITSYAAANGWRVGGNTLDLTPGVWMLFASVSVLSANNVNHFRGIISTDNIMTGSGSILGANYNRFASTTLVYGSSSIGGPLIYPIDTITTLYLKTFAEDATTEDLQVGATAIRIA